jgi:hypothetical protein
VPDPIPLDYVLTLTDLRRPGVDFTERVPLRHGPHYAQDNALAEAARLRLAAKASELRPLDPDDQYSEEQTATREFVGRVLDVTHPTQPQSVVGVQLTFITTVRRAVS